MKVQIEIGLTEACILLMMGEEYTKSKQYKDMTEDGYKAFHLFMGRVSDAFDKLGGHKDTSN